MERRDNKEQGLAPGNYFKVVKVDRVTPARGSTASGAPAAPPKKIIAPQQEKNVERADNDMDDDNEEPAPPLPGPPPAWSDTIAGKAAQEIAKQFASNSKQPSKSPRSPRAVQDLFQPSELNARLSGALVLCSACKEENRPGFKNCEACGRPA